MEEAVEVSDCPVYVALYHLHFAPKVKEIQSSCRMDAVRKMTTGSRRDVPESLSELKGFVNYTLPLFVVTHFGITLDSGIINIIHRFCKRSHTVKAKSLRKRWP